MNDTGFNQDTEGITTLDFGYCDVSFYIKDGLVYYKIQWQDTPNAWDKLEKAEPWNGFYGIVMSPSTIPLMRLPVIDEGKRTIQRYIDMTIPRGIAYVTFFDKDACHMAMICDPMDDNGFQSIQEYCDLINDFVGFIVLSFDFLFQESPGWFDVSGKSTFEITVNSEMEITDPVSRGIRPDMVSKMAQEDSDSSSVGISGVEYSVLRYFGMCPNRNDLDAASYLGISNDMCIELIRNLLRRNLLTVTHNGGIINTRLGSQMCAFMAQMKAMGHDTRLL